MVPLNIKCFASNDRKVSVTGFTETLRKKNIVPPDNGSAAYIKP